MLEKPCTVLLTMAAQEVRSVMSYFADSINDVNDRLTNSENNESWNDQHTTK